VPGRVGPAAVGNDGAMTASGPAPRPRPDLQWVELDGEVVVYDDGVLHKLDPIATVVWKALDGVTTLDELADELAEVYGADREQVLADVRAWVAVARSQRLLADEA